MNILFLGRFYPKGIVESIVNDTRGRVGFSNHNFEMSLIRGFSDLKDVNLRVLTAPMVYSYPHNNRNAFVRKTNYVEDNYPVHSIGFCNIAVLNRFSEHLALTKAIRKEIKAFGGDELTIVVNTPSLILSSSLFKALSQIKYKRIRTVLIVPDVPECMVEMSGKMTLKNRLVRLLNKRNARLSQRYDKYVYLTEAMNDFYHAAPKDYIVMEGLIDESKITDRFITQDAYRSKEIILYTGTLRRIFGVMSLINAFEKGNFNNTELWICGSGETADEISERARQNKNIKFFGLVDSDKARELQSRATILANPRSAEGRYTRYSFPSKTIEYLLAGRTVIMNRLPGVPAEYDSFLFYPDDESEEAWIRKLNEILSMPDNERTDRNIAGRNFILSSKIATAQCSRIVSLVSKQ